MMKVQVLFFGATAETVGKREIEMDVGVGAKSGDIFDELKLQYPKLKEHSLLFAVNQEYSNGSETLKSDDELAIFTAVSGG